MAQHALVDVSAVAARLDDPQLRLVDCRFDLGDAAAGALAHERGHLPGAVYAHLDADLSGPRTPWSGRHPLPDADVLARTLGAFGIDAATTVYAYDDSGGIYAARLWWLARWLGHERIALIDGGLGAWRSAGLPLETGPVVSAGRSFSGTPRPGRHVSADDVASGLATGAYLVLDARSAERYEGRVEPLDPRAGHVPGARNHHYARNLGPDGRFLPPAELRARFGAVLGARPPHEVISMCGSGVTACHTLLALELAGLPGAQLYVGSFSEWSRDPARRVATGPAP